MTKFFKKFVNLFTKNQNHEIRNIETKFIFDSNLSASPAKYKLTSQDENESTYEKYVALYEYKKQAAEDIDLLPNDHLLILHKTYPDFYSVRNLRTKRSGFVPSNFIEPLNSNSRDKLKNKDRE